MTMTSSMWNFHAPKYGVYVRFSTNLTGMLQQKHKKKSMQMYMLYIAKHQWMEVIIFLSLSPLFVSKVYKQWKLSLWRARMVLKAKPRILLTRYIYVLPSSKTKRTYFCYTTIKHVFNVKKLFAIDIKL